MTRIRGMNEGPVHVVRDAAHAIEVQAGLRGNRDFLFVTRAKFDSWSTLLDDLIKRPATLVSGRECVIEAESTLDADTKSVIRAIGRELYASGATRVTCHGRVIARPAQQLTLEKAS